MTATRIAHAVVAWLIYGEAGNCFADLPGAERALHAILERSRYQHQHQQQQQEEDNFYVDATEAARDNVYQSRAKTERLFRNLIAEMRTTHMRRFTACEMADALHTLRTEYDHWEEEEDGDGEDCKEAGRMNTSAATSTPYTPDNNDWSWAGLFRAALFLPRIKA